MKPLTVCMFSNLFAPVVSGSSTQAEGLSRELSKRGHQVIVITAQTPENHNNYEALEGVHIYRLPAIPLPRMRISFNFPWLSYTFTPGNLKRVHRILHKHQPDVLHLHNHMFDLAFIAVLMRRHIKKPLVVTIHTIVKHSLLRYNLLLAPFDRIILKNLVVQQAEVIINPDLNTQRYVVETFGRRDSVIVPYGITLPQVTADSTVEYIKSKYHLMGKQVILSLGHVHDIRNRTDLIEAMPYILRQVPNAVLLIVGSIATQEPIQRVKRLGLQDSVIFSDYVPHYQIPAFLELTDIEVHWLNQDSMENTSLGIASLEAMWAGKVVLAAANERTYGDGVLKNGENIILVAPGNSKKVAEIIVHLLENKEKRVTIGAKARQTIMKHFSWESVCTQTIQVYQEAERKQAQP